MRLAAYAGASTALAGAVILRAFSERPNFYSAAVYLGQSNACRLILMNFLLLTAGSTLYALQRILYGPLRSIEIEQLWDKGWYAVTETALAMTTFRDEVGGWFFILFMSLLAGKVWGWIGEGRLEILEQQPPANPRLFHARLITSLLVSELFNVLMLNYCVRTLQEQPRPGMMVMFAFEFAVLVISSSSTLARYALTLREKYIVQQQTKTRIEERRREIRQRAEQASREGGEAQDHALEEEIDENEIDVPGWQEKGRWVLVLDLITDLLKLVLYVGFFFILLLFSGIPIHMFRDLYMTLRSFIKRISDYLKYRSATRDMNSRYPDATGEELDRDGTCIICREEMRPWEQHNHQQDQQQAAGRPQTLQSAADERQRPKKLPCGHILHIGCLRSWLERQQVCPTCRAPVIVPNIATTNLPQQQQGNAGVGGDRGAHENMNRPGGQQGQGGGPPQPNNNNMDDALRRRVPGIRARTWGLGNFRFTLAAGNGQAIRRALEGRNPNNANDLTGGLLESLRQGVPQDQNASVSARQELDVLERRINSEIDALNLERHRLAYVRALNNALDALRNEQHHGPLSGTLPQQQETATPGPSVPQSSGPLPAPSSQPSQPAMSTSPPVGSTSQLPEGLTLPEGWTLTPLTPRNPAPFAPPQVAANRVSHIHVGNGDGHHGTSRVNGANSHSSAQQTAPRDAILQGATQQLQNLQRILNQGRSTGVAGQEAQSNGHPVEARPQQLSSGDYAAPAAAQPPAAAATRTDTEPINWRPPTQNAGTEAGNSAAEGRASHSDATASAEQESAAPWLPDWSSGAASAPAQPSQTDQGESEAKGKNKVPTVEDAQDDQDGM